MSVSSNSTPTPTSSLLTESTDRYVMFPIKDNDIWKMYKKQVDCFWRAEEIDLSRDMEDWAKLNSDEKHFIKMILAFFAASDGIVLENLAGRFMEEVQLAEARVYGFQIAMENIHSETYSLLIDSYKDDTEKTRLFKALDNFRCIQRKPNGLSDGFMTRKVISLLVSLLLLVWKASFFRAFCVFIGSKRGLMPGLTFSNEFISRDEALHTEFAVLLYSKLGTPLDTKRIHQIIKEAVDIEIEFICSALPCRLIGMNAESMTTYIRFVADRLSVQMGCDKIYNARNPFEFMEMISLESKTNFFESRVSDYALAEKTRDATVFDLDDAF